MSRSTLPYLALSAALTVSLATPAAAAITVIGHYRFANGDTVTRASYYTSKQVRTTLPNGDELIYDASVRRIALIDHEGKRYWEGPRAQADSIAGRIRAERMRAAAAAVTPETRESINRIYNAVTDSVHVVKTGNTRKIAGYPCSQWVLTAGHLLIQERWVARSLDVPDYSSDVEKVVMATILDPLGSGLMKLVLQARTMDGLGLAGKITYKTLRQQGEFSWEAVSVSSARIPPEAWKVPEGYQRWQPPDTVQVK
jgi:hypothetical protein